MRKVLIKKWIPIVWEDQAGKECKSNVPGCTKRAGTHAYEPECSTPGLFHAWGCDSDEGASYSVAIVELQDGSIEFVTVSNIKFINPWELINEIDGWGAKFLGGQANG